MAQGKEWKSTGRPAGLNTAANNLSRSQTEWLIALRWKVLVGQGELDKEKASAKAQMLQVKVNTECEHAVLHRRVCKYKNETHGKAAQGV